jgi:hypothetical protein
MAAVAEQIDSGEKLRTFLPSVEERKGLILSHLMGFALFSDFALNIFRYSFPFTPITSIPIRLIAIWLIIDRVNRIGRLRMATWDYIVLTFVTLTCIGYVITATTSPGIPVDFGDFRRFIGNILGFYIYFLVAKEALNRRGFRPDITVYWLIAGFTWSAVLGIMQTLGILGARRWGMIYANPTLIAMRGESLTGEGSSFASGTASWWTSMASEMLVAFALVFGPTFRRRPYWWEWCLGVLFMAALIGTQSRGGLLVFGACVVAAVCWYVYHKKILTAIIMATTVGIAVTIWVFAVFALKIEKFTVTLSGEKVRSSVYAQSLTGRMSQQRELIQIGLKQPVFGTGPNNSLLPGAGAGYKIWSSYAVIGSTDTTYGFVFAQFGLIGLAFLIAVEAYLIGFIRKSTAYRPYAFAAFFVGVTFAVHGLAESLIYQRIFIVMGLLAAYAGSNYLVSEKGRSPFHRIVKVGRPGDVSKDALVP